MKNNKGFSLVELIIVIAIMAILVGVMAPQLIKYIEKTNVSSDIQLCKTVKTAMETAATDAAVANETDYTAPKEGDTGNTKSALPNYGGTVFSSSFEETLGVKTNTALNSQVKSTLGKEEVKSGNAISYKWVSDSSVVVYIDNTNKNGSKKAADKKSPSATNCECIYAGPVELW